MYNYIHNLFECKLIDLVIILRRCIDAHSIICKLIGESVVVIFLQLLIFQLFYIISVNKILICFLLFSVSRSYGINTDK